MDNEVVVLVTAARDTVATGENASQPPWYSTIHAVVVTTTTIEKRLIIIIILSMEFVLVVHVKRERKCTLYRSIDWLQNQHQRSKYPC